MWRMGEGEYSIIILKLISLSSSITEAVSILLKTYGKLPIEFLLLTKMDQQGQVWPYHRSQSKLLFCDKAQAGLAVTV